MIGKVQNPRNPKGRERRPMPYNRYPLWMVTDLQDGKLHRFHCTTKSHTYEELQWMLYHCVVEAFAKRFCRINKFLIRNTKI
jgi:hypothetical protein